MNFNWLLDSVAAQVPVGDPDRTAVCFDGEVRLTYAGLRERTLRLARALHDLGLSKGDRIAMLLFNDPEYIPLYLAAARLGLISVRLNFRLAPAELQFILTDSEARVVVAHSSLLERIGPIRDRLSVRDYVVLADNDSPGPEWAIPYAEFAGREPLAPAEAPAVGEDDPIALLYTSGTTGTPKGAVWSHRNTIAIASIQALKWQFSEDTVALVPGPLYHAGGFEAALSPALLGHGTAVCLRSGSFTTGRLLDVLRSERVTDCLVYSFMLDEIVRLEDLEVQLSPSVRRLIVGGDTLMPRTVEAFRRRLPDVELCQVYGLTEGGCLSTTLDGRDLVAQPRSVGRPFPLTEVRVVRSDRTLADTDEVGEIEVRSPSVVAGYWRRPEASEATFIDGWCRTGDLGSVNADGFLAIAGRAKDMIRSGAENIYPAEVEKVLTKCPGVVDAAVIAVPDERFGEVGAAIVVGGEAEAPEDAAMRDFCREHLARYKVPRYFVLAEELPRNASGKVLKYVLREQYRDLGARAPRTPAT